MLDSLQQPQAGTVYIDDLEVGLSRELSKTFTNKDIEQFAAISMDHNPIHLCDEYGKESVFGGRIAHGMLTASLLSAVIGEHLPGRGTIYLGQSLRFIAPVRPGDRVTARVTVTEIKPEKRHVTLDCVCTVGDTVVLKGEALVLAPRKKD